MKRIALFILLFVAGWIFFDEVLGRLALFVLGTPDATLEKVIEPFVWAFFLVPPVLLFVYVIYRFIKWLRSRSTLTPYKGPDNGTSLRTDV